jgi:hypothetical protein
MQIQIVTTSVETKPTAKGSYQQLEVVYKNLSFQGKVESKKIMSFGANANTFKTLAEAAAGTTWEVTVVKNAAGYNDWPTVVSAAAATASQTTGPVPGMSQQKTAYTPTPKSNYETSEERAQRQILIVRQSSVSSAVAALSAGSKSAPKVDDVISYAKELESYVFGVDSSPPEQGTGFEDMPDFEADIT